MKQIEQYVDDVVSGLPIDKEEQEELKEELTIHLMDHISELMIKGYSKEEAISQAIVSFGKQNSINLEMKKVLFPYYKIFRYVWNVFFVTAMLCVLSYASMEFYNPEFDNTLPVESVVMAFCLVVLFVGVAEVLYEAIIKEYQSKWLTNPWRLFLIPALLIGLVMSIPLVRNPDQYSGWLWIDLYVVPISVIFYLLSRQLFTWLFVQKKRKRKSIC